MVQAVLADYRTAPIAEAERELFAYLEKVNTECANVNAADVERLHNVGWTDEAIFDAVLACALFHFYNRWIDATGVHAMSARDHEFSGKRLAESGYLMGPR